MRTHTIRLADRQDAVGTVRGVTPVFYGTAKHIGIAPGTNMLILYNAGRGTAYLRGWPYGEPAGDYAARILHGDVLAIGKDRFRVHCPENWPRREPDLHLIATTEHAVTYPEGTGMPDTDTQARIAITVRQEPRTIEAAHLDLHDYLDELRLDDLRRLVEATAHMPAEAIVRPRDTGVDVLWVASVTNTIPADRGDDEETETAVLESDAALAELRQRLAGEGVIPSTD
ncbi:hypothetical protein [Nocardia miyunensis]|uniref:hypothetical protein n=1 Tax=Nocardia miyunensis TaxID=282684 RepID=UPI000833E534|nr:hypothetical protein [Nocardia miyunensis]